MKITFLASDYWKKNEADVKVKYMKGGQKIFGVKKYADSLDKVVDRYGIDIVWQCNLVRLNPEKKEAVFVDLPSGEEFTEEYDMIHVTPYQSAPDFIKQSPLADADGWVDVDKHTTQHVRYPNVFGLGDCTNFPTAKTGAAVRKQAPVAVENIEAFVDGKKLSPKYNGYTSCPLITGYGSLILAEFDYENNPQESFPFDQAKERYSMYALKAYALPQMYWNGMLRGREF